MDPTTEWTIVGIVAFLIFCKVTLHMRNSADIREDQARRITEMRSELDELKTPPEDT